MTSTANVKVTVLVIVAAHRSSKLIMILMY